MPANTLHLPLLLKKQGYTLGGFGKWGLGPMGSTGDPLKQGFDRWYGYNCQAVAHNFYPTHLWDNDKQVTLNNPKFAANQKLPATADPKDPAAYTGFSGKDYAPDLIAEQAREFVRTNKDRPFFLYYPTTVPHLALQVPEDSLHEYDGAFPDDPPVAAQGSYVACEKPRATYAAMVTRMDRSVGRMLALLKELKLDENTLVIFTSDNGGQLDAGANCGPLRGGKQNMYEGGIRVPMCAMGPGRIDPGSKSDTVALTMDLHATVCDAGGLKPPSGVDGVPVLRGATVQDRDLFWVRREGGAPYWGRDYYAMRRGPWKLVQNTPFEPYELYNLDDDPRETRDLAKADTKRWRDMAEALSRHAQDAGRTPWQ